MKPRDLIDLVLVAAMVAFAIWGGRERAGKLRAEGAAEVYRDQADSAAAVADTRLSALEAIQLQEDPRIALRTAQRDSAVARAAELEAAIRDAGARARRAAAAASSAEEQVRAYLARDSAGLAVFDGYVQAVAVQTAALEERAVAAESRGNLLAIGLAAADSIGASRTRELDAALAVVEPLRTALAARTAEADGWRRAARPGKLLGLFHVEPGPAFVVGAVLGTVATVVVLK